VPDPGPPGSRGEPGPAGAAEPRGPPVSQGLLARVARRVSEGLRVRGGRAACAVPLERIASDVPAVRRAAKMRRRPMANWDSGTGRRGEILGGEGGWRCGSAHLVDDAAAGFVLLADRVAHHAQRRVALVGERLEADDVLRAEVGEVGSGRRARGFEGGSAMAGSWEGGE
jgi:hypothetical protein